MACRDLVVQRRKSLPSTQKAKKKRRPWPEKQGEVSMLIAKQQNDHPISVTFEDMSNAARHIISRLFHCAKGVQFLSENLPRGFRPMLTRK